MTLRMIFLAAVLALTSCVSPQAIKTVKDGMAANKGHMNDAGLPKHSREIATDNYDLLANVLYNLDGTPVPEDTAQRRIARVPTPEAETSRGE